MVSSESGESRYALEHWPDGVSWVCNCDDCDQFSGMFDSDADAIEGFRLHVRAEHPMYVGIVP